MNNLTKKINNYIHLHGPITFERFMDFALYDEQFGYYTNNIKNIGKTGDFYTSPSLSASFGKVITNFIIKGSSIINKDNIFIIELGSGSGYLAFDILNSLKLTTIDLYNKIKYICIEVSDKNIEYSKEILHEHIKKIIFIKKINDIKEKLNGFVISNELFDSIPFHRIKFSNGEAKEICISTKNNNFVELLQDIKDIYLEKLIGGLDCNFIDDQQIEINTRYENLINYISYILGSGFLLTFDYGYLNKELYNPKRFNGTYRCFFKHKISENPYNNIGYQDITCSVDFSSIIDIGAKYGLRVMKYVTQGQFLLDWGILEIIKQASEYDRANIKNLLLPEVMGDKFKALIQVKNLNSLKTGFYPESNLKISYQSSNDRLPD